MSQKTHCYPKAKTPLRSSVKRRLPHSPITTKSAKKSTTNTSEPLPECEIKLVDINLQLSKKLNLIQQDIQLINSKYSELENTIQQLKPLIHLCDPMIEDDPSILMDAAQLLNKLTTEVNERLKRSKHVIFLNIPDALDPSRTINGLMRDLGTIAVPFTCHRLSRKNTKYPCPILARFNNEDIVRKLLKNQHVLRIKSSLPNLKVAPDRTRLQRECQKQIKRDKPVITNDLIDLDESGHYADNMKSLPNVRTNNRLIEGAYHSTTSSTTPTSMATASPNTRKCQSLTSSPNPRSTSRTSALKQSRSAPSSPNAVSPELNLRDPLTQSHTTNPSEPVCPPIYFPTLSTQKMRRATNNKGSTSYSSLATCAPESTLPTQNETSNSPENTATNTKISSSQQSINGSKFTKPHQVAQRTKSLLPLPTTRIRTQRVKNVSIENTVIPQSTAVVNGFQFTRPPPPLMSLPLTSLPVPHPSQAMAPVPFTSSASHARPPPLMSIPHLFPPVNTTYPTYAYDIQAAAWKAILELIRFIK